MSKKYPPSIHLKVPATLQAFIDKRCKDLNKASIDDEQRWNKSKYIRWLIRRDMKEELPTTKRPQAQQAATTSGDDFYDSLLNLTRR